MNKKRMLLKTLGGAVACPAFAAPAIKSPSLVNHTSYFPNTVLTTHENRKVKFYDDLIKGKIVVINMMYGMCTEFCPADTASLMQLQEALGERVGRDIFMYSLTLLPELDTPQALNDYVKKYGIKPGWTFLTGKRADVELIRRKLGFYSRRTEEDADIAQHTGMVRIGNDRFDRWCMAPAQSSTRQLVSAILSV
jgi:protein SCO1/2